MTDYSTSFTTPYAGMSDREIGVRVRLITERNPYMAQRPDAVDALARMPYDTVSLMDVVGQQYGMMTADTLADQLKGLRGSEQRGIVSQLTPAQQAALANMGYQPPEQDEGSLLGDIIGVGGKIISPITSGLGKALSATPIDDMVLSGLSWVGNWPGHIYRSIRLMDDPQQWMGLIGAVVGGAAAIAAAPFTGGGSLAALGVLGMGAMLGGTAGAALTAPGDWYNAFQRSENGERTFDNAAMAKAEALLRDPRMVGLARDLALDDEFDIEMFATELAAASATERPNQLKVVEKLAGRMAEAGSPEFQQVATAMTNALQDPTFQKAVRTLQEGKMSPGRDLVDIFMDPGHRFYGFLSGTTDAIFQMSMDPTLMLGKGMEAYKATKYGLNLAENGTVLAHTFKQVANEPAVLRGHQRFVEIVNRAEQGAANELRSVMPEMAPLYQDVIQYRNKMVELYPELKGAEFTVDNLHEFFQSKAGIAAMLKGHGTVVNRAGQIQMRAYSRVRMDGIRRLRMEARSLTTGLSDGRTMRRLEELANKTGLTVDERRIMPVSSQDLLNDLGVIDKPELIVFGKGAEDAAGARAYRMGRALASSENQILEYPSRILGKIGDILTSGTTMAMSGKAMHLTGDLAVRDVRAATEAMRYVGMPAVARQAWADAILSADSTAARMQAAHGMMASMARLVGMDASPEGQRILNEFLDASKKLYGIGDELTVNGRNMHAGLLASQQADMLVMPDLRTLRRAVEQSTTAKFLGITEHPVLEAMVNKVWKPVLLLRIGFIPRAAGEEAANFLLRGNIGSLTQEAGSRYLGRRDAYFAAVKKWNEIQNGARHLAMTIDEQALVQAGWYATLPKHMQPVARMMERYGLESDLATTTLLDYSKWMDRQLRDGFGIFGLRRLGNKITPGGVSKLELRSGNLAGRGYLDLEWRARRGTENAARWMDSIVFGNEHSIRRMILGGVDDDLVHAGRIWAEQHATTLMRVASATNAGPLSPMYDSSQLVHEMVTDSSGVRRPVALLRVKGERKYVMHGDPLYATGMTEELAALAHDPITRDAFLEHAVRVKGGARIDEARLTELMAPLENIMGGNSPRAMTHIVTQLMGEPDLQQWRTMVDTIAEWDPHLGATLRLLPQRAVPDVDDVIVALEHAATNVTGFSGRANRYITELTDARTTLRALETMDPRTRNFTEQFLTAQMMGGQNSWWARSADARASGSWLYNTLDDTYDGMRPTLAGTITSVSAHDAGVSKALRGRTVFKDQTTSLFEVPALHGSYTYDDLLRASKRPDLIVQHKAKIERLLALDEDAITLVDDLELAAELHRVVAAVRGLDPDLARYPRMLRVPHEIKDGRMHQAVVPIDDGTKRLGAWKMPQDMGDAMLRQTPREITDAADQWANELWSHSTKTIGDEVKLTRRAKTRAGDPLDDGTVPQVPLVYRYDSGVQLDDMGDPLPLSTEEMASGNFRPVDPDEVLTADDQILYDYKGRPIDPGDTDLFDFPQEVYDDLPPSGVIWEAWGPHMRDMAASHYGYTLYQRAPVGATGTLKPTQTAAMMPLRNARVRHVDQLPGQSARGVAIGSVYRTRRVGKFEEMVQFGFDKVIGPSIDAIIRRPMAYHAFVQRYSAARRAADWLVDGELSAKVSALASQYVQFGTAHPDEVLQLAADYKALMLGDGAVDAAKWSDAEALAHLRGGSVDDLQELISRTLQNSGFRSSVGVNITESASAAEEALDAARRLAKRAPNQVWRVGHATNSPREFVAAVEGILGEGALASERALMAALSNPKLAQNPLIQFIQDNDAWDTVRAMRTNFDHVERMTAEYATTAAIDDVVPYLDSHEFKTQFAEYGRGLMPFWYAEENFMKRWARALADQGPQMIRKAQLTYMGLKHAGVIRTDASGRDWFVYPGSGLLATAISKAIPGLSEIGKTGLMFQTPTDAMLPGLNNRFGTPSFNPLVSIPMDLTAGMFGELQPLNRALLGDYASNERNDVLTAIFPAHIRNLFDSIRGGDENARYASAQMSAIAYLEARDQGLREGATPAEIEDFLDRVRSHARINVVAQAMMGFLAPGPSSSILAGGTDTFGMNAVDWGNILGDEYLRLIRLLGVEEGTNAFLEANPDATVNDIVRPEVYTVPRRVSASGAPIPSTEDALSYYEQHRNYMDELPNAAPYLMPQMESGVRSQYAYDAEVAYGLRRSRSPEEFVRAIQFKKAAPTYFAMREGFLTEISALEIAGDVQGAKAKRIEMEYQMQIFRAANPIFKEELESSGGRQRRARAIEEMRVLTSDPLAPDSPQLQPLRDMMKAYDGYKARLASYSGKRSAKALAEVDNLKQQFQSYMTGLVTTYPGVASFWLGVLQPESSLD